MSDTNATDQKKQYSIVRYSRIRDMTTLRHVSNHNTRAVVSENVQRDGPAPVELLADGNPDITVAARRRAVELGLDLPAAIRDGKVIAVEAFMGASPEFFERATTQEVEDWYRSSTAFMERRFGRALISVIKHEDEKTPHLQAVALAAVEKKAGVRGRPPRDPERRRLHDEKVAAMPLRWTFSYNDLLGGAAARLSHEQDDYNACVRHLGLVRGERQKEVSDLVLDNGVVVSAARISRGKRQDGTDRPARHFTTQEYQAETRRDRAKSARQQREAEADRAVAAADRALAAEARAVADAAQAEVVASAADFARREAALVVQEREMATAHDNAKREEAAAVEARADAERLADEHRRAAVELAEAARLRKEQEADIARQRREVADLRVVAAAERDAAGRHSIELDAARVAMIASRDQAAADAVTAARSRQNAEAAVAAAERELAAIADQRQRIDDDRRLDEAQLALLARAADDAAGMDLRLKGERFAIGPNGLNDEDRAIKAKGWSQPLIAMARSLATALDRVRAIARQLHDRERAIEKSAADVIARETRLAQERATHDLRVADHQRAAADLDRRQQKIGAQAAAATARDARLAEDRAMHEARVAAHQRAIADLDRRDAALAAEERRVAEAATAAEAQRVAAVAAQARADTILRDHRRWIDVIDTLEGQPDLVDVGPDGVLVLEGHAAAAAPALAEAFETAPPDWVVSLSVQRLDLADALQRADERERGAAYAAERLEAMIEQAGPALTPSQRGVATEAERTIRLYRPRLEGVER
ncbi:plasmid recombination protein [Sphingomonas sp.]|uniref:plasmid recombination protein n=1 Tax=Sphingomonas sp. TaxID=28214 RepID=UPI0035C7B3C7